MAEETTVANIQLRNWGRIAAFQKKLIDETNVLINDHHRQTLSDVHAGSIYRSTAFIIIEIFGEYLCNILEEFFGLSAKPAKIEITIREKDSADVILHVELPRDLPQTSGFLLSEIKEEKTKLSSTHGKIEITYDYRFYLDDDKKDVVSNHIEKTHPILTQLVHIIEEECLLIAGANQTIRDNLSLTSHYVFEKPSIYYAFFRDLIENAKRRFFEVHDTSSGRILFQIMLYLPVSVPIETAVRNPEEQENTATERKGHRIKGAFFYPYFDTDNITDDEINYDKIKEMDNEHDLFSPVFNTLITLGGNTHDETFNTFLGIVFNKSLREKMVNEGLKKKEEWNRYTISALQKLYLDYKSNYGSFFDNDNKQFVKKVENFLGSKLTVSSDIFEKIYNTLKEKVQELNIPTNEETFSPLWSEIPADDLVVYQPQGQGVVGDLIDHFLPLRIRDQRYSTLRFSKREGVAYNVMGILENRYGIGGGNNPVALVPLTAKGQLLGALYVVKKPVKHHTSDSFTTSEMRTLEFISKYISENIQEARDVYAIKKLKLPDRAENRHISVIKQFLEAISIVTNVLSVQVREGFPDQFTAYGLDGLEPTRTAPWLQYHKDAIWNFVIPPAIWEEDAFKQYWLVQIEFAEHHDIIANYKCEIEQLYRIILHALGLKASGVEQYQENIDWMYRLLGAPPNEENLAKQKQLSKSGAKEELQSDYTHTLKTKIITFTDWKLINCDNGSCNKRKSHAPDHFNGSPLEKCIFCWLNRAGISSNSTSVNPKHINTIRALLFDVVITQLPITNIVARIEQIYAE